MFYLIMFMLEIEQTRIVKKPITLKIYLKRIIFSVRKGINN